MYFLWLSHCDMDISNATSVPWSLDDFIAIQPAHGCRRTVWDVHNACAHTVSIESELKIWNLTEYEHIKIPSKKKPRKIYDLTTAKHAQKVLSHWEIVGLINVSLEFPSQWEKQIVFIAPISIWELYHNLILRVRCGQYQVRRSGGADSSQWRFRFKGTLHQFHGTWWNHWREADSCKYFYHKSPRRS